MTGVEGECLVNTDTINLQYRETIVKNDNPIQRKYISLRQKCEQIQQNNEKLVNRIQHVKRLTKRYKRERRFLTTRLDKYGDEYKDQLVPTLWEEHGPSTVNPIVPSMVASQGILQIKSEPTDRHTTAFKNFCNQHQLQIHSLHSQGTGDELSPAEMSSQLKMKWNKMTLQQRQLYMDITPSDVNSDPKILHKMMIGKVSKGIHSQAKQTG